MNGNGEDRANDGKLPLAARPASCASPFDRPAWFDLLAAHGFDGMGRYNPCGTADQLSAWLALRRERGDHFAGLVNWYSFAIRPLYTGIGEQCAALAALFASMRRKAATLELYPVPDAEQQIVAAALRASGWWVRAAPAGTRHWLDLGGLDHDTWWASRPGALRSTVQRKARKNIVEIELFDRFDDQVWADYEAIYAASWKSEEGDPALLRAFALSEGARGALRMGIARINGAPVAAQFWTIEEKTAFIHKLAHVEDSLKASPGTLLSAALFRHMIKVEGVNCIDFGTGDDGYKKDWMNRCEPLWRLEAFNRSRVAAWGPALKAFARSILRKDN